MLYNVLYLHGKPATMPAAAATCCVQLCQHIEGPTPAAGLAGVPDPHRSPTYTTCNPSVGVS